MSKLGKRLINAAKSAQAIAKGEADPKTYKVHVPAHLDVRAIRTKLKMSQNVFAARFGILPSTLRDWEQKRRHPDGAARVLLMVIDKEPEPPEPHTGKETKDLIQAFYSLSERPRQRLLDLAKSLNETDPDIRPGHAFP